MERELTTIFADAHHDGAIEKRALKASKQPHVVRLLSLALSRSLSLSPSRSLSVFLFPWPLGHVRSNADFPPDERRSSLFLLRRCSTREHDPLRLKPCFLSRTAATFPSLSPVPSLRAPRWSCFGKRGRERSKDCGSEFPFFLLKGFS